VALTFGLVDEEHVGIPGTELQKWSRGSRGRGRVRGLLARLGMGHPDRRRIVAKVESGKPRSWEGAASEVKDGAASGVRGDRGAAMTSGTWHRRPDLGAWRLLGIEGSMGTVTAAKASSAS
jgi:hypothetical protein